MKTYYVYSWNCKEDGSRCGGLLTSFETITDEKALAMARAWYEEGRIPNDHYSVIADGVQLFRK